jgi:hypothetical protein
MQELDYRTAFADFMEHVYPLAFPHGKRSGTEYNRIMQAKYAYKGRGKQALTANWVARILEDYAHLAPGRYKIESGVRIYLEQ